MSYTVDDIHAPDVIGGCTVAGNVLDEEIFGRTFIHCGEDKFAKDFCLERIDNDGMINFYRVLTPVCTLLHKFQPHIHCITKNNTG